MSGDTQPKKRKDKKRKKDDEDTVKETTVHAPKQPSAGAAQAAKEPGDIQMHIHSDHGTGGHWCAKVVFFILLAGLGALIGLILMESQGVSNDDTPLSESRYSEFFNGWVDETRQDEHHHDEILAAINSLEDHDDGEAQHAVDDHDDGDDDGHDQDGDDEHDDGAPYAEEEDHDDDEEGTDVQDDDEDEGPAQKLDDDEVEEIFTQQEAGAQQEAAAAAEDDDNDDDEDEDEDGDGQDDDDDDEAESAVKTDAAGNTNVADGDDDDDDDQDDTLFDEDDADDDGDEAEIEEVTRGSQPADDDDDEAFGELVDNDEGEEEYLEKVRTEQQRRAAAEEERRAAAEPVEESSLTVKIFVGVALLGAAHLLLTSPRAPTTKKATNQTDETTRTAASVPVISEPAPLNRSAEQRQALNASPTATVLDDFLYAGPPDQLQSEKDQGIEGNVILFDENDDAERYSGDEYEYELEELEEEAEPEEVDEEEEKQLIKQEQEIGAFVPITFEDFNSMYRVPTEVADADVPMAARQREAEIPIPSPTIERSSSKRGAKDSLLARKKPPKGAFNKLIYGLHKDPIVIPSDEPESTIRAAASENVSAKVEAKSVLTALLSEIPSPPIEPDHAFVTLVPTGSTTPSTSAVLPSAPSTGVAQPAVKAKHVEFLLPERDDEPESERTSSPLPVSDNGSKENLFIPQDTSEEELEPNEYGEEEYGEYAQEEEEEDELVYEDEEIDDIESVLLNQYGSDEEEEPLTDDNIPPGGDEEEASDVDDSDLMRRLEEKYGKLPAATTEAAPAADGNGDDEEAAAAGWTKIPSRAEEADRSYQEELRRAEQQLDEGKPQEALAIFDRIILGKPKSIAALVGRARCLDALAEQRRSNAILTEAITAYRKVIEQELAVDDATFKTVAERCIDRMRFQGQHAKAIDVHKALIRRFDNEPQYRNQLAVSYLYMNRLAEAKAVLHETLLRWIDDGFALVHYGFVLKTLDQNMELAAQYLQEGIETEHPGTQDGRFYFQLGDALQRLGRNGEALNVYRKGVQKKLFLSLYQRSLYNVEGLRSRPFWTEAQTTYTTELELIRAQWQQVRDEGMKLLNSAGVFVNESENLRDRGDWKQLELFSRGARVERNCARAPLTCRLVEQYFPAARTCKRGQVKFSVMHPGTHVWPHCGPTNCRIRAHLGLSVPQGTYIRVAEETRSWENGKWLIFDDSFEHEVWHNGTETRLVLIVDFWHPELTESQRRTLSPI